MFPLLLRRQIGFESDFHIYSGQNRGTGCATPDSTDTPRRESRPGRYLMRHEKKRDEGQGSGLEGQGSGLAMTHHPEGRGRGSRE